MKRIILMLTVAAMMVVALSVTAPSSFAISQQAECEAQGGTFTNNKGTKECVVVVEGKNPKFEEETETSQQGRIGNQGTGPAQEETECNRPGAAEDCPPGQFKD